MIQSDDPFEREVRWLAHLEEDARLNERIVTKVAKFGGDARSFQERGAALRDFFQKIATKLPAGYHTLPGNPSVEAMLEDLGQTRIYPVYTLHTAYVHGSHASTWLYRKHLGTLKEAGEFIAADSWYLPLWTGWTSLQVLGSYVLERLGATTSDFVSPDQGRGYRPGVECSRGGVIGCPCRSKKQICSYRPRARPIFKVVRSTLACYLIR